MSARVHAIAAAGWDGAGADDYERGRPGYPRAAVEAIGEIGPPPPWTGRRVLDLAAGTGKLTRELGILGAEVIAVEPLAGMRSQLAAAVPGVTVLDGTAEHIPLPDGAVHAVCVAQAFHWFNVPVAAAEIARVLDAGGGLAIVRNEWTIEDGPEWARAYREFFRQRVERPDAQGRKWPEELDATGYFTPFHERVVPNPQTSDLAGLRHRTASMSAIAALPADEREALLDAFDALLVERGITPGQELAVPMRTVVRWAHVRERVG